MELLETEPLGDYALKSIVKKTAIESKLSFLYLRQPMFVFHSLYIAV